MSVRTEGFVCIGRNGDEYSFVTSVFKHDDDFYGCTGSTVRPVSEKEWDWASNPENVAERLEDYYNELHGDDIWDDDADIETLDEFVERAIDTDGIEHLMFDGSDTCDASAAFDDMGVEHEYTDCIGGGRMFGKGSDYDEIINRKAQVACEAYEAGAVSYEYAVKAIFG